MSKVEVRLQCLGLTRVPTLQAVGDPRLVCNPFWPLWLLPPRKSGLGRPERLPLEADQGLNAGSATFQPVKMLGIPLPTALTHPTPGTVPEGGLEVDPYGLRLLSFRFS